MSKPRYMWVVQRVDTGEYFADPGWTVDMNQARLYTGVGPAKNSINGHSWHNARLRGLLVGQHLRAWPLAFEVAGEPVEWEVS